MKEELYALCTILSLAAIGLVAALAIPMDSVPADPLAFMEQSTSSTDIAP